MKTSTLVVGMTGSGILGGVVGAWVFLAFFADSFAPKPAAAPPAAGPAEPEFSEEEAAALRKVPKRLEELEGSIDALRKERRGATPPAPRAAPGAAPPAEVAGPAEQIRRNETAAIATLRNLASCQAQIQVSGKIDGDNDGIGEYGTFLEMTGSVGVRRGHSPGPPPTGDFTLKGSQVNPPILSPALADVDAMGIATKNGYAYMIFLPDGRSPAGWVHETGPAAAVALSGAVGVDLSETTWCAYAWPVARGSSGNRAFFVNQSGDVLQSANGSAAHNGVASAIDPASAFRGAGITSQVAVGTAGRDGDVWKVTN